jgi:hypothetical protein
MNPLAFVPESLVALAEGMPIQTIGELKDIAKDIQNSEKAVWLEWTDQIVWLCAKMDAVHATKYLCIDLQDFVVCYGAGPNSEAGFTKAIKILSRR